MFDEKAPPDAHGERRVVGFQIQVHEEEAQIVRRSFDLYAHQRLSVNEIERTLNKEGVPWPGAATKKAINRRGWAHSTVVAIIDSEKYRGRWVWNRRHWYKDPSDGKRRYVDRPKRFPIRAVSRR